MSLGSLAYYIMRKFVISVGNTLFNVVKKGNCDGLEM